MSMEYKHTLTYGILWKYKEDSKTSLELCLSEFIDNSIASYEITPERVNNPMDRLVVTITYHIRKNVGQSNPVGKYYTILDNANGMNMSTLESAMIQYKNSEAKKQTSMNQYGIGMKFGIFWIGSDADIYSKEQYCSEFVGRYDAFGKQESEDVVSKTSLSDKKVIPYSSGTEIKIKNVYKHRALTNAKMESLKTFFSFRYAPYLTDGNLEIILEVIEHVYNPKTGLEDVTKTNKVCIDKDAALNSRLKYFNLKDIFPNDEKREKIIQVINTEETENPEWSEFIRQKVDMLKNCEDMTFDDYLTIPKAMGNWMDGDKPVFSTTEFIKAPIKVHILSEPSKTLCGLGIIHNKRYIHHPSPSNKEMNAVKNYPLVLNERNFEGRYKWLYLELNLEDIPGNNSCEFIKPDKNKSQIIFDLSESKLESNSSYLENSGYLNQFSFEESLQDYVKKVLPLLKLLTKLSATKSELKKYDIDKSLKEIKEDENNYAHGIQFDAQENNLIFDNKFQSLSFLDNKKMIKIHLNYENDINDVILSKKEETEDEIIYDFNPCNKWFNYKNNGLTISINFMAFLVGIDLALSKKEGSTLSECNDVQELIELIGEKKIKEEC